jgi:hypothetical protein
MKAKEAIVRGVATVMIAALVARVPLVVAVRLRVARARVREVRAQDLVAHVPALVALGRVEIVAVAHVRVVRVGIVVAAEIARRVDVHLTGATKRVSPVRRARPHRRS